MNRAEVRKCSRLAEREGELFIRIEHFGLEGLWIIRADHRVRNVVLVDPRHRSSDRHGQSGWAKREVVNLDFRCFKLLLRACDEARLTRAERSQTEQKRCSQSCSKDSSP